MGPPMMTDETAPLTAHEAFRDLLIALQMLYANEGTEGGTEAAVALGMAAINLADTPLPLCDDPTNGAWTNAFLAAPGPMDALLQAAAPLIPWFHAGLDDGKIAPETARRMLTAELVGPTAPIHNDLLRVGLFWQDAGVDYPVRSHAAEECYIMLAGKGGWSADHAPHSPRTPGEVIFHPSFIAHASRTDTTPMLAVWRWSGDISWDSYVCTNAPPAGTMQEA